MANVVDGWVCCDYHGSDFSKVAIAAHGLREPATFRPAFLDYVDGVRVAKIPLPRSGATLHVKLSVDGSVRDDGSVSV